MPYLPIFITTHYNKTPTNRITKYPNSNYPTRFQKAQEKEREEIEHEDEVPLENFRNNLLKISKRSEVITEDIGEWMECDSSDSGFQILRGQELIESEREESVEEEDDLNVEVRADTGPSVSKAFVNRETEVDLAAV